MYLINGDVGLQFRMALVFITLGQIARKINVDARIGTILYAHYVKFSSRLHTFSGNRVQISA